MSQNSDANSRPVWKKVVKFFLDQWLILGMGIVCILAYFFPQVAKPGGAIRSEYSILYGAMAIIFLISGLSIPQENLARQLFNWRLHALVQVVSFVFIPALVLAIVHVILAGDTHARIDRAALAGYIFTACIPTTIASNVVMTRAAGGDDAAALAEVLIANLLGPFITPGWTVTLLPASAEFDPWRNQNGNLTQMYRNVFKQLGLTVLLPLAVGQCVRWFWPKRTTQVIQKYHVAKVGTLCLLLMIWTTFSSCFATGALEALSTETIIFIVFFNVALYVFLTALCFCLARPPWRLSTWTVGRWHAFKPMSPEETIAVCFCGPAKSTALGIPLLYAMWTPIDLFSKAKTSVPVLLYTTEQLFVAHIFVHAFRRWNRRLDQIRDCENQTLQEDPQPDMIDQTSASVSEPRAKGGLEDCNSEKSPQGHTRNSL